VGKGGKRKKEKRDLLAQDKSSTIKLQTVAGDMGGASRGERRGGRENDLLPSTGYKD